MVSEAGEVEGGPDGEPFFRTLAEMIPQMVWTKDANGVNDYCNGRFRDYMQMTTEEFISNSWIVAHPDDVAHGQAVWREAIASGTAYEVELRLRPKHKLEYRWFLLRAVPHRDRTGRVIKWFGTTTDIDDHKRYLVRQEETVHVLLGLLSPDALPVLDTVRLDAVYQPAEDLANIGGDFYASFALPDGRLLVAIGDVAGHGLAAAVSMERTRNAILTAAIDARDPAVVLTNVNRVLALRGEPAFVTALVGFLDPGTGEYTYASAGHCGPLLREGSGIVRELPHGGVPLGVQENPRFPTVNGRLETGEMLVLYTDGIIEFDRNLEVGQKRLAAAVAALPADPQVRPAEFLRREVLGTAQATDDVALLTVSFIGAA